MSACFPYFHVVEGNPVTNFPRPEPAFIIKSEEPLPLNSTHSKDGDVYTFADNIVGYTIRVERDNITLDGGGYTLRVTLHLTGEDIPPRVW